MPGARVKRRLDAVSGPRAESLVRGTGMGLGALGWKSGVHFLIFEYISML